MKIWCRRFALTMLAMVLRRLFASDSIPQIKIDAQHSQPVFQTQTSASSSSVAGRTAVAIAAIFLVLGVIFAGAVSFGALNHSWRGVPILSDSMAPAFHRGDVVVVVDRPVSSLHSGSVIVAKPDNANVGYVMHRVIAIDRNGRTTVVHTKGDANISPDPWQTVIDGATVPVVQHNVPHLATLYWALQSSKARFVIFLLVVPMFAIVMLQSIWSTGAKSLQHLSRRRRRVRRARPVVALTLVMLVLLQADPAFAWTVQTNQTAGSTATGSLLTYTPSALTCKWNGSNVSFDWTAASQTMVTGYEIFGSSTSGGPYASTGLTTSDRLTVTSGQIPTTDAFNNFYNIRSTRNLWQSNPNPATELPSSACYRTISTIASSPNSGTATAIGGIFRSIVFAGTTAYLADLEGDVIWKLDTTNGTMSVIGGNFSQALPTEGVDARTSAINQPYALALDASAQNLYFTDGGNNRIRKINLSTNVVNTVVGTGTSATAAGVDGDGGDALSATLKAPQGLVLDSSGNMYIADSGINRIRKVNASDNKINTIAGTGTAGTAAGANGDGAAATSALLNNPLGLTLGPGQTKLYIADGGDHTVRYLDFSTGNIDVYAGNGTTATATGTLGDGAAATAAKIKTPQGLVFDGSGNLFIADSGDNKIRRVDVTTKFISTVAGTGTSATLLQTNGDGGAATSAKLSSPQGVAFDANGNLWICDFTTRRVRNIVSGTINNVVGNGYQNWTADGGSPVGAGLDRPAAVVTDAAGNIYFSETSNQRVRKISASTGFISTIAGDGTTATSTGALGDGGQATAAQLNSPYGLALDSTQTNLYIADTTDNKIRKVNLSTGIMSTVAGTGTAAIVGAANGDGGDPLSATLKGPYGIALDSADNIYVADTSLNRIRKINAARTAITALAGDGTAASVDSTLSASEFNSPRAVLVDPSNDNILYIAEYSGSRIRKIDISGNAVTTFAGGGASNPGDGGLATSAKLSGPTGLTMDSNRNLYIADSTSRRVRVVVPSNNFIYAIAGNTSTSVYGSDGDGGVSYSSSVRLNVTQGVAVLPNGDIVVTDNQSHRIRKLSR